MGLRSLVEISPVAYLGALEIAVPSFTGNDGICPQLEVVVGGPEIWRGDGSSEDRWDVFLHSESRADLKLTSLL